MELSMGYSPGGTLLHWYSGYNVRRDNILEEL